jgi:hypothetical protein
VILPAEGRPAADCKDRVEAYITYAVKIAGAKLRSLRGEHLP